jgi:hypothetical protein
VRHPLHAHLLPHARRRRRLPRLAGARRVRGGHVLFLDATRAADAVLLLSSPITGEASMFLARFLSSYTSWSAALLCGGGGGRRFSVVVVSCTDDRYPRFTSARVYSPSPDHPDLPNNQWFWHDACRIERSPAAD